MSIPLDPVTGVSGFVMPGDVVDVVLTRPIPGSDATADEQMATVVLQNVAVLAIDARASERAALLSLIERAGDSGLTANINFA